MVLPKRGQLVKVVRYEPYIIEPDESAKKRQSTTEEKILAIKGRQCNLMQQIEKLIATHEIFVEAVRTAISEIIKLNNDLSSYESSI